MNYNINRMPKDDKSLMEAVLNKISMMDMDYICCIDVANNEFIGIDALGFQSGNSNNQHEKYSEWIYNFINRYVVRSQRMAASESLNLDKIIEELNAKEVYSCDYSLVMDGKEKRVCWKYSYLDESSEMILSIRSDITEQYRQQEEQKENLRNALFQAENASRAKTDFLSRMSHDIRTPMNAIIGMNALAAQNIGNPVQVADCISKVGISARYLLSLINDILDMSRIESGKVTVKKEKFSFEDVISAVNAIAYERAIEKKIDYECIITSFTDLFYIGDAMKMQQILVNLLGNAVKFTPECGKVQLIVHQKNIEGGRAQLVFKVNDTGIGISKEAQKYIFDAFMQEDKVRGGNYKGSGLGLAICKNLTAIMDGNIQVNSIEGVGSEFTVEIPLDLCEDSNQIRHDEKIQELGSLHTLIVDDDILVCEQTDRILREIGMKPEWVDSGIKAVERVTERIKEKDSYDVILVDLKMPGMDGIETVREIRKIVGPEVTVIIMTAYDWISIEREAKAAGVDLCISKPLFKNSIVNAFAKAYHIEEMHEEKPVIDYDFTGKRVLLVEDHLLNIEVAKNLLEVKHFTVDVAKNGIEAIEAFTGNKPYYYDVILMDIQMPIMDGLTAANAIRHLSREDAHLVPILAMSANAFEEDAIKSRSAGMNIHLAKPIEPDELYKAIWEYTNQG